MTCKAVVILTLFAALAGSAWAAEVQWWLTTSDKTALLAQQPSPVDGGAAAGVDHTVRVHFSQQYQSVAGFGFALTGGSADHLIRMEPAKRIQLLEELFSAGGVGISYLRLSLGASDLNERVFSYDDVPSGEADWNLEKFSLGEDRVNVVPVLKEILAINPTMEILASPWSAPVWMKTNQNIQGGMLRPECYEVYAQYFVKYVKAMAAEGVRIHAVTVQNEPFNDGNTPSMQMFAKDQARFIRDHLGPAFRRARLDTKIIVYDHNCDAPEYPLSVLGDAKARPYVAGSGFHLYAGDVSAMTKVHDAYPEKDIYFTEMMAVSRKDFRIDRHVARIAIGAMRNWSRNVILWNLAADSAFRPHTDNGGCSICQGALTIDGNTVERNVAYYVVAHFSKFVPPHSRRAASTETERVKTAAFVTPNGLRVVVVANTADTAQANRIEGGAVSFAVTLPPRSVSTFVWPNAQLD